MRQEVYPVLFHKNDHFYVLVRQRLQIPKGNVLALILPKQENSYFFFFFFHYLSYSSKGNSNNPFKYRFLRCFG